MLELIETGRSFVPAFAGFTEGLAGYWRMEETAWAGAAGEVIDLSGQGNHGQAINGANTIAAGKLERCGDFQKALRQYVNLGTSVGDYTDNFTIAAWFKTGTQNARLFSRRDASVQYDFYVNVGTGQLVFYFGPTRFGPAVDAADNAWHLGVVVANGANSKIYLDGVPGAAFSSSISSFPINAQIGAWGAVGNGSMNGQIDEVAIWALPFLDSDVLDLYNENAGGIIPLSDSFASPVGLTDIRPELEVVEA